MSEELRLFRLLDSRLFSKEVLVGAPLVLRLRFRAGIVQSRFEFTAVKH